MLSPRVMATITAGAMAGYTTSPQPSQRRARSAASGTSGWAQRPQKRLRPYLAHRCQQDTSSPASA